MFSQWNRRIVTPPFSATSSAGCAPA